MSNIVDKNGNPIDTMTDEEKQEMEELHKVMQTPEMNEMVALMILVWRMYYVVRLGMQHVSQGKLDDEKAGYLMQSIMAKAAAEPINTYDLKKSVRKYLFPFLDSIKVEQKVPKKEETPVEREGDGVQESETPVSDMP